MSVKEKMTAIADNIRSKTGKTTPLNLDDIASGVNEVYEAGKEKEWSDFWDAYQQNGQRKNYSYAFFNNTTDSLNWTNKTFKPKYDMIPTNASRMFYQIRGISNLGECLSNLGVKLDLSKSASNSFIFQNSNLTRVPTIDCSGVTVSDGLAGMFAWSAIDTIDKWILPSNGKQFSNTFAGNHSLKNIVVEGVIDRSISFSTCPLTAESMKNIVKHLKNYAGTDKEYAYTITVKEKTDIELCNLGFTLEDIEWLDENGIEHPEFEEREDENGVYGHPDFYWASVIDEFKWNLVTVA